MREPLTSTVWTAPPPRFPRPEGAEYRPGPTLSDVLQGGSVLSRGDAGEGVRALQALLNALGAAPPLAVDGLFGPKTQAALQGFQGGLSSGRPNPSGRCDGDTLLTLLGQALGQPPRSSADPGPGSAGAALDDFGRRTEGGAARAPSFGARPAPGQLRAGALQLEDSLRQNRDRVAREAPSPRTAERAESAGDRTAPTPAGPGRPAGGRAPDLSAMVDWAKDRVGQPYVFGKNDCGTMVRDYIKHFGLKPGPGSDNHMMLPKPLDFYGAFEAKDGRLEPMRDRGAVLGKNHQDIAPGMIFGIGELCPMSDCRALGHAPDGTSFNTLYSCSHSGIITKVVREGGRPDGRITDFGFAEMHGSVKGGGPGMTFHDSFAAWAGSKSRSDFHHAFVYAPPAAATGAPAEPAPGAPASSPGGSSPSRREQIDRVWAREAGGTYRGLVEWDETEAFPSLGPFHNTWDNPAAGAAGRAGGNSFSDFLRFAAARGAEIPSAARDQDGAVLDRSPWSSKAEMERDPQRLDALRRWLSDPHVQDLQLSFAEDRLGRLAKDLGPEAQRAYQQIAAQGATDLLVDLVNFKGEGAVRGTLARFSGEGEVRRAVAEAAWQTLQATRSSRDLGLYGAGWRNRLEGYWRES